MVSIPMLSPAALCGGLARSNKSLSKNISSSGRHQLAASNQESEEESCRISIAFSPSEFLRIFNQESKNRTRIQRSVRRAAQERLRPRDRDAVAVYRARDGGQRTSRTLNRAGGRSADCLVKRLWSRQLERQDTCHG